MVKKTNKNSGLIGKIRRFIHLHSRRDCINENKRNTMQVIEENAQFVEKESEYLGKNIADLMNRCSVLERQQHGIIQFIDNIYKSFSDTKKQPNEIMNSVKILDDRFSLFGKQQYEILQFGERNNKVVIDVKNRCAGISKILQNTQSELILLKLQNKLKNGKKIKIGFYVIFDSVFPAAPVFEKFMKDKNFEPFILVIPDVSRGEESMFCQMKQTYDTLSKKYKNVYKSYDEKTKTFIDYSDLVDIVFFANPYETMTHEYYRISTASDNGILTLFTNYGYQISNINQWMFNSAHFKKLWKIFLIDKHEQDLLQNNDTKGFNGYLVGYCKLDKLSAIKKTKRIRKKIIIAPHHTVMHWKNGLELSNFVRYAGFFIDLFKKYSDIDFVFRPHPLLWINLKNNNIWTQKQIDDYLKKISKLPNVEYQNGGDYLETFVNSDALIHDCGSFSAEYLFVNKPCCY